MKGEYRKHVSEKGKAKGADEKHKTVSRKKHAKERRSM